MKFKSLKTRILVWFGGITAVILILFSVAFYYYLVKSIDLKLQTQLYQQAEFIEEEIASGIPLDTILQKESLQNIEIAIVKDGKILAQSQNFALDNLEYYARHKDRFFRFETEQYISGMYVMKLDKPDDEAVIVQTHKINNSAEDVEDILLVMEPVLLLLLLLAGSKVIDKILTPVKKVTQAAGKISINNFTGTIPIPEEEDEIKALVVSFNSMIERLKEGVDKLDRFNSDVSHELKTPLTVIKGETEITLRKHRDTQTYIKSMQTIAYEASQIEQIVEDLLLLTRYTRENIRQTFQLCHLDAMVLESLEKHDASLKKRHITLKIEKLEPVVIQANPLLLHTIFSNLIDNAVKYTPEHKKITIALYQDQKIHFMIKDEGCGIPKEALPRITDRFYRVDVSRNKKIKGFGLGLALVENAVKLHNGKLKIDSEIGKGTTVEVVL